MKILMSRHDKLGDFVLALPAFYVLRQAFPEDSLTACVSPVNQGFASSLASLGWFNHVMVFDPSKLSQFRQQLREAQFDVALALFADLPLTYALFMEGIPKRIAPATKLAQLFANHRITQRRSRCTQTEWEYNLDLLKALDVHHFDFPRPLVYFSKQEVSENFAKFCTRYQISEGSKVIVLHPGSGGSAKVNLTLEEYIDLALHLKNTKQAMPVFSFGPDEGVLLQKMQAHPLAKQLPVYMATEGVLADVKFFSAIDLLISNSTGVSHLAGLANTQTLTIFDPSVPPARWQPISEPSKQHHLTVHPKEQQFFLKEKLIPYLDSLLTKKDIH